jgi:hypothetical protein
MSITSLIITVFFNICLLTWFFLSVLLQISPSHKLAVLNRISVVPNWRFFAPVPLTADLAVMYRCADSPCNISRSNWHELRLDETRRWFNFVWNPHRRFRKAFFDLIVALSNETQGNFGRIKLSVPYIFLLQLVTNRAMIIGAPYVQFSVFVKSLLQENEDWELMFVSAVHRAK